MYVPCWPLQGVDTPPLDPVLLQLQLPVKLLVWAGKIALPSKESRPEGFPYGNAARAASYGSFSDRLLGALGRVCGLTFVILREDF